MSGLGGRWLTVNRGQHSIGVLPPSCRPVVLVNLVYFLELALVCSPDVCVA